MGEGMIGFGLYQSWRNMGKVGSVFWLRWCGGGVVGGQLGSERGRGGVMFVCVVSLDYLC